MTERNFFYQPAPGRLFLDHAALSPISLTVRTAAETHIASMYKGGMFDVQDWGDRIGQAQKLVAHLIGAKNPEDILFTPNTSSGILRILNSLVWNENDNAVIFENDFPANTYPLKNLSARSNPGHTIELRTVRETNFRYAPEDIVASIDDNTRVIAASLVNYSAGTRLPLDVVIEAAQKHNALILLDTIQGLGNTEFSLEKFPVDFIFSGGYKWLMAGAGTGFAYISERGREYLQNLIPSYAAAEDPFNYTDPEQAISRSARALETGVPSFLHTHMLSASLEAFAVTGWSEVFRRALDNALWLRNALPREGFPLISNPGNDSPITLFSTPGVDPAELQHILFENNVYVSQRRDGLRVSPHFYNTQEDLEHFINALKTAKKTIH